MDAFHPVPGNSPLTPGVKSAIARAGLVGFDGLRFCLQPTMEFDSMLSPLALGAEMGAQDALVIGIDSGWSRLCDSFGRDGGTAGPGHARAHYHVGPHLRNGLSIVCVNWGTAIVGTPQQAVDEMLTQLRLGIDEFILSRFPVR